MNRLFYSLIFLAFLSGCSTGYRPLDWYPKFGPPGGYEDKQLSENTFELAYYGNEFSKSKKIEKLWERRALELCPKGFNIKSRDSKIDVKQGRVYLALNTGFYDFNKTAELPVVKGIIECDLIQ